MLLNLLGQNGQVIGRARYFFWIRHYTLTLRVGLIALCLGLTVATAVLIKESGPIVGMMPVIGILALAGFLFIYYNLELTLLLTVIVSIMLHVGIGTGTGTPVTFTFLLLCISAAVWLFKKVAIEKSLTGRPAPIYVPGLLFMITVVIATLWSGAFVEDEISYLFMDKVNPRVMTALVMIISVITCYLFANVISSIRSMRFYVWLFIVVGVVFAILKLSGVGVPTLFNVGGQFSAWVVILAFGQFLFNDKLSFKLRLLCISLCATWLYIIFLGVTWLSGWLPTTVGVVTLSFLRSRKLFLLVLLVMIAIVLVKGDSASETLEAENAESGSTRVEAWDRVLDLIKDHLLFGTGAAGYHFYFTVYISGFYQLSHNNYVDILAQTGIVGFVFYIWFWLAMGVTALRTFLSVPRTGFRYAFAATLLAAYAITIVTMMLGDWVTPFPYTQTLAGIDYTIWHWMMAGMTVALYYESQNHASSLPALLDS